MGWSESRRLPALLYHTLFYPPRAPDAWVTSLCPFRSKSRRGSEIQWGTDGSATLSPNRISKRSTWDASKLMVDGCLTQCQHERLAISEHEERGERGRVMGLGGGDGGGSEEEENGRVGMESRSAIKMALEKMDSGDSNFAVVALRLKNTSMTHPGVEGKLGLFSVVPSLEIALICIFVYLVHVTYIASVVHAHLSLSVCVKFRLYHSL